MGVGVIVWVGVGVIAWVEGSDSLLWVWVSIVWVGGGGCDCVGGCGCDCVGVEGSVWVVQS